MAISEGNATGGELLAISSDPAVAPSQPFPRAGQITGDGDRTLRRVLAAGDAAAVFLALALARLAGGQPGVGQDLLWGLVALPTTVVLFKLYGLYDRDVKRISHSTVDDLPRVFHATVIGVLLLWLYAKYTPMRQLDFREVLSFSLLMLLITMSTRAAIRASQAHLAPPEATLLIGGGKLAHMLSSKLAAHPEFRSRVIGLLDDDTSADGSLSPVPVLGSVDQLEEVVKAHGVRRVIVSASHADDQQELEDVLRRCRQLSLKFSLLPRLSDMLGPAVEIDDVEGITVLGINPPWLPRSSRAVKRALDIFVAATLLIVFAPVITLVVIAIRLDSRGPAFFAQTRVGRNGRRFRVHKFRTMVVDAEQRRAALVQQSSDPHWLKLDRDPRITRVGRHLRRLSFDEVPQLWNVLRGEMSMVGPRPLIETEDERVEGWARGRLDLTPGMTGYWQVLGRTRIPFEEMVKLDYLYVMNWSLWQDVQLMLRTVPVLLSGRGAN